MNLTRRSLFAAFSAALSARWWPKPRRYEPPAVGVIGDVEKFMIENCCAVGTGYRFKYLKAHAQPEGKL